MKAETKFRTGKVDPFLKTLKHSFFFSIQQIAIVGTPDKIGCCRGRFVALEIKSEGGKLSKLQEWFLQCVTRAGGVALVVYPSNFEEVKGFLWGLDEKSSP